jgi:hypothetical protein
MVLSLQIGMVILLVTETLPIFINNLAPANLYKNKLAPTFMVVGAFCFKAYGFLFLIPVLTFIVIFFRFWELYFLLNTCKSYV